MDNFLLLGMSQEKQPWSSGIFCIFLFGMRGVRDYCHYKKWPYHEDTTGIYTPSTIIFGFVE